jgi:N-acetylmuramoyl-L-alanine amidase
VELGNMQNKTDQKRLTKEDNRQALADWLYEGLIK